MRMRMIWGEGGRGIHVRRQWKICKAGSWADRMGNFYCIICLARIEGRDSSWYTF